MVEWPSISRFFAGVAIFTGAIVGLWAGADPSDETSDGVLFAGGLITGEALTGILLAVPIVISGEQTWRVGDSCSV